MRSNGTKNGTHCKGIQKCRIAQERPEDGIRGGAPALNAAWRKIFTCL